ncbi:MAG: M48 family metalloprotease, partial [Thermoleophilia bacterium]
PAVQCLTVPTVGMNAFTFSDLHGGACIGVTEGALSRLSREQLQGVVAQEFGHVLSGDYETATTACLLFGIYGDLADSLDDGLSTRDGRAGISLISGVLRLLQAASAVTNAALSRQREWVADAAAAHFTRDPLSLAQALQMMIRHPGGGGYIPDALSALCIRPTDLSPSTWVARAMATHPPVNDRIAALLNLAHVGWDQFQEQAAVAEAVFEQREHVTEAPGSAAAAPGADRLVQVLAAPLAAATTAPVSPTIAATTAPARPAAASAAPAAVPSPSVATRPPAPSLCIHDMPLQALRCPSCGATLEPFDYEGTTVHVCRSCAGRLAATSQVQRILTRREIRFDEQQQRLADFVVEHGDELRRDLARRRATTHVTLIACPHCARSMVRRHYSYDLAVEIDYCVACDLFWFEKDELEVLQVIMERRAQ